MRTRRRTVLAAAVVSAIVALAPATPAAQADVPGVRAILPVGEGSSASLLQLTQFEATGQVPASFTNEQASFEDLISDAPHMNDALIAQDFPSSTIGVDGATSSVESPRSGVSISWDKLGVPHITGQTFYDVMFGAGYAQAQARLFSMDVLRHLGEGRLTSFVGPGTNNSNLTADENVLAESDYDAAERQAQINQLPAEFGTQGELTVQAADAYVDGINARIAADKADPLLMPAEYAATGNTPQPWTTGDLVAIGAEINQGFDLGGGAGAIDGEIQSELRQRLGAKRAGRVWNDISFQNSRLSPSTTSQRFAYPEPAHIDPAAVAMPDSNSLQSVTPVTAVGSSSSAASARATTAHTSWASRLGLSRLGRKGGDSFAVLVGSAHSSSGHPIADMGPQLDFFSPELLLDESLSGPGINVRGAALPGAAPVPIVGHTSSFAWSVTIGVGQHISVFALKLCNPNDSPATRSSDHYLYRGACVPMLERTTTERTTTSLDNTAAPQTFEIHTLRSVYGPIDATGTVHGQPVAFARADATYGHLADTGVVLAELADGTVDSPQSFVQTVRAAPFSLNWFYIDGSNIAWTLSGRYPEIATKRVRVVVRRWRRHGRHRHRVRRVLHRIEGPSPTAPIWGTGVWDWRGFNSNASSATGLSQYDEDALPGPSVPHVINPASGEIVNWNNKPAPGWRASDDDFYFGPVQRVQIYRQRLASAYAANQGRIDEAQLVGLVEDGDTVDLRGSLVLPWLLKAIGNGNTPQSQQLISVLRAWVATGAHRRDTSGDGLDDDGAAARLMDAWWPRLVPAIFEPVLGSSAYDQTVSVSPIDDPPPLDAEAWYDGWYGQVQQDMRDVLARRHHPAGGHLSRVYCGGTTRRSGTRADRGRPSRRRRPGDDRSVALEPPGYVPGAGLRPAQLRRDRLHSHGCDRHQSGAVAEPSHLPAGRRLPVVRG
jgi:acyl-homoserine lactone acylase PvdQ